MLANQLHCASMTKDQSKMVGGLARAQSLDPERRSEIAKAAAAARWNPEMPKATHQGQLDLGEIQLDCYVLEDGRRLFHKRGMARALGMKSGGGNVFMKAVTRKGLGSVVPIELKDKLENPIIFNHLAGDPAHGYEADTLIEVCDSIIEARNQGKLLSSQAGLASYAEALIRSVAKVGIVSLIDEATGYQEIRKQGELAKLLSKWIEQEKHRQWTKTFPIEFYEEMFRLKGWDLLNPQSSRPGVVGTYTNDLVYARLAPGLLTELRDKNPPSPKGHRKRKHHQWLTKDVGHPRLLEHLAAVIALMKAANDWEQFKKMAKRGLPPKYNETIEMPL